MDTKKVRLTLRYKKVHKIDAYFNELTKKISHIGLKCNKYRLNRQNYFKNSEDSYL